MSDRYNDYEEDNGMVVADMSELSRPPLLLPRFNEWGRESRNGGTGSNNRVGAGRDIGSGDDASGRYDDYRPSQTYQQQINLDRDERRALIGGAVSAGLLVVGCLAAGFGALIWIILNVWGH